MGNKLYVGNLPYSVRDGDLEQSFSAFGSVTSAKVMMERDTGRSKGFGFVEMGSDEQAQAAIAGMNGQNLGGRNLVVNEARPMEARPPRAGGGGFGGPRRRWRRLRRRLLILLPVARAVLARLAFERTVEPGVWQHPQQPRHPGHGPGHHDQAIACCDGPCRPLGKGGRT